MSIYLDHSATTPVDDRVLEVMLPYFSQHYGNPSSIHRWGQTAEAAVERARRTVAEILNCQPREVIFTSCGSESDNLAIRGAAIAARHAGQGRHLISQPLEHSAVAKTCRQLETYFDFDCTYLSVDSQGQIAPNMLQDALRDDTTVVSLMLANNEIGTLLPIAELAGITHERGAVFHTDAVQAGGQVALDVQRLGVDMLSLSAHKFYGPKGAGILFLREGTALIPSQSGGSHEFGLRSGTHNVPLIVGMAKALEIATAEFEAHTNHYKTLRDRLIEGVLARIPDAELTGDPVNRLPSHTSFAFKHLDANMLLMQLDMRGIAASSGSACKVGNPEPSSILIALGYDEQWTLGGLRLTVGRQTTTHEIDTVLEVLPEAVKSVRQLWVAV